MTAGRKKGRENERLQEKLIADLSRVKVQEMQTNWRRQLSDK